MNTVKILHCADFHIGATVGFLKQNAETRRAETLLTAEKIIDLGVEKGIDVLLIAGDLFDSNKVESRFVEAIFAKISTAPFPVVAVCGNHDPLNAESPYKTNVLPQNLYVLGTADECIEFGDLNLCVWGRSFENSSLKGEEFFTLKTNPEKINILLQHGDLKSDIKGEYNSITPAFVKSCGMDYIALGHVHKRSEIGNIADTYFAYPGCPEPQGFDELDDKGVYLGEIGKGSCNLEFVPTAKRRHIHEKCDITGLLGEEEISAKILESLKEKYENFSENLYKIELVGEISAEAQINLAEIESRIIPFVFFVKVKDGSEISLDLEKISSEASLKGIFIKRMLEKINSAEEQDKQTLKNALNLGLKAFLGEVKYNED